MKTIKSIVFDQKYECSVAEGFMAFLTENKVSYTENKANGEIVITLLNSKSEVNELFKVYATCCVEQGYSKLASICSMGNHDLSAISLLIDCHDNISITDTEEYHCDFYDHRHFVYGTFDGLDIRFELWEKDGLVTLAKYVAFLDRDYTLFMDYSGSICLK